MLVLTSSSKVVVDKIQLHGIITSLQYGINFITDYFILHVTKKNLTFNLRNKLKVKINF